MDKDFSEISFQELTAKSDSDGIIFMGLSIPKDEKEDILNQIEIWFKDIKMINQPGVKIKGMHKIVENILGENGRTDWFVEWNKDFIPSPIIRLRYSQDIKWISDFLDNYKDDYYYDVTENLQSKRSKSEIFESIMKSVSKEVRKAINESFEEEADEELIYDNFNEAATDEDYEEELRERPEEETNSLFYDYVRKHNFEDLCDYFDVVEEDKDSIDITNEDIDEYFNECPEEKKTSFEKFKKEDKEDFCNKIEELEWHDFKVKCRKVEGDFIIYGSKERWDKKSNGADIEADINILDVLSKHCKDCELIKVSLTSDKGLHVICSHHDGANDFFIYKLNEKGKEIMQDLYNAETEEDEHEYIQQLKSSYMHEEIEIE